MDLKAYLKGAGIGIIVTAVILMIVGACNDKNNKISDEEVIKRAKELGYVESSTLTSPSSLNGQDKETQIADSNDTEVKPDETKTPDSPDTDVTEPDNKEADNTESGNTDTEAKDSDIKEPEKQDSEKKEPDIKEPETNEPKKTDSSDSEEYVIITIYSGQGSEEAARACKEAGLVDDSVAFNSYMCANGYDRRLNVGNHEIPVGADNETICKKLCGME